MKDFKSEDWEEDSSPEDFGEELEEIKEGEFVAVCNNCNTNMDVDLEVVNEHEVHTYYCEGCDVSVSVYFPLSK